MKTFVLSLIFLTLLVSWATFYIKKTISSESTEINNFRDSDYDVYANKISEKGDSKNIRNDFLDFSGGTLGI